MGFRIYFAVLGQEFRNAGIFFYLDRLFNGHRTKPQNGTKGTKAESFLISLFGLLCSFVA
jgi:hypothetical protein